MSSGPTDFATRLDGIIARQRSAYLRDGFPTLETRIDRLKRAQRLLIGNAEATAAALSKDYGHRSRDVTMIADIYVTSMGIRHAIDHLETWMSPEPREAMAEGAQARVEYTPKGVVGVIGPWNFTYNLVFAPLTGILAAGNRAVLKPSEITPEGSALMGRLVADAFDPDEVAVVTGGPDESAAFTRAAFNHIIFTGSPGVGAKVMAAAAEKLTPVTLELGGKNPAVVTEEFDLAEAARRIMAIKGFNAGQICLESDYVLVPRGRERPFAEACVAATRELFPDGVGSPDYTAIITDHHYDRLVGVVEDARAKGADVLEAFPGMNRKEARLLSPTFLVNATDDMEAMKAEIFGPVLPIIGYDGIQDVIGRVRRGGSPLALYYFGKDDDELRTVLDGTASGGVTVNDVMTHAFDHDLPFGGIERSGSGAYHSKAGFTTFSHARAVYVQSPDPAATLAFRQPFSGQMRQLINDALQQEISA